MRYLVPQFISREVKIVGPLSFRQFMFVGGGFGVCFILYFALSSFFLFLFLSALVMALAFALAFYKYNHVPLPELIANLTAYFFKGRVFLWEKKAIVPRAYETPEYKPEKKEEPHRISSRRRSQLENLSTQIETKL